MEISGIYIRDFIVSVHAISAFLGIGAVLLTDLLFFKLMKNFRFSLEEIGKMKKLSNIIWVILTVLVLSGIYLTITGGLIYESPKFILKMTVVGIVIINGFFLNFYVTPKLHRISFHESHTDENDLPDKMRKIAMFAGAISFLSWGLAFTLGKMNVLPMALSSGIALYLGLIILIVIVASLTKRKRA